jgi:hypothetical protein
MLGKSMQIPVGVVCLFVCFLQVWKAERARAPQHHEQQAKQSKAKQQGMCHTVALPFRF